MSSCMLSTDHFSSSFCKSIDCQEYRKDDGDIGQRCCQVTGYIPGNMPMCPHDMDKQTLKNYGNRRDIRHLLKTFETPGTIQTDLFSFSKKPKRKTRSAPA